jgi:hypothetical protein
MRFDYVEAKKHYTDTEIADYLAQEKGFDIKGARSAGYADLDIISELASEKFEPAETKQAFETRLKTEAVPEEEIKAETETGLEEPWVDPTMAATGGFGAGTSMAAKGLTNIGTALARGALSGATAAAVDLPIGVATEAVAGKYPKMALPLNLAVGVLTGIGLEGPLEKSIIKSVQKASSKGKINVDDLMKSVRELVPEKATEIEQAVTKQMPKIKPPEGAVAAGSLEYGAELPKYAGAVNIERTGLDYDAKKLLVDTADRYKGAFDEAKRGVITHEETRKLADELGLTVEELLKRQKGEAWNAEKITAARDLLNTSTQRVLKVRDEAARIGSDEALANFRLALEQHAAIQSEVSGLATEAGRSLQSHRIKSMATKGYKAIIEALGGREISEDILSRLARIDTSDPVAVNKFLGIITDAKTKDKIFEVWVNALLSSPTTHVVNNVSNTLTFMSKVPEKAAAAGIDFLRSGITGKPRERFLREAGLFGIRQGLRDGLRRAVWAFNNEMTAAMASKIEVPRYAAIKGAKGRAVRLPGRMLMAADEFFKAVNYTTELNALAYRQAVKEGKKGASRAQRIGEIIQNPTKELVEKAEAEMYYRTFQKALGSSGAQLNRLRMQVPGMKYIIPFLRTPVNIAKFGLERTPLNYGRILVKAMKGELKGGEMSEELARATMGSLVGAGTFMYARDGFVTGGGPKNKSEREALYRTGWQPYSVKLGDTYFSYQRMEPLGMILGTAADASDIWDEMNAEEQDDIASMIVSSIYRNFTNKTFMRGISDLMNAMSDPARYGENWIQRLAGSVVPTGVATAARAIDPEIKQAENIIDSIKSRIPGVRSGLMPKRDLWGNKIVQGEGGVFERMVSPLYRSKVEGTPADKEILRLKVHKLAPRKKIKDIELTPEQYDVFMARAGQRAHDRVNRFVQSSAYKGMSDEKRAKEIVKRYDRVMKQEKARAYRIVKKGGSL